jgi:hypothetical protein
MDTVSLPACHRAHADRLAMLLLVAASIGLILLVVAGLGVDLLFPQPDPDPVLSPFRWHALAVNLA